PLEYKMKKLFITLSMTLMSINAMAGWTEFGGSSTDGRVKTYYDKATARNQDHVMRVWQTKDYATPQATDNKTYLSVKSLLEVNCKTKMIKSMAYTYYHQNMGHGEAVLKNSSPAEWRNIAPDINLEAMRKFYCGI
ncbi:MAG: hypothetical protein Q8M45_02235, partial [Methylotenera sp.]|nr:hypothetical protein [Methylotenera sp.]